MKRYKYIPSTYMYLKVHEIYNLRKINEHFKIKKKVEFGLFFFFYFFLKKCFPNSVFFCSFPLSRSHTRSLLLRHHNFYFLLLFYFYFSLSDVINSNSNIYFPKYSHLFHHFGLSALEPSIVLVAIHCPKDDEAFHHLNKKYLNLYIYQDL